VSKTEEASVSVIAARIALASTVHADEASRLEQASREAHQSQRALQRRRGLH